MSNSWRRAARRTGIYSFALAPLVGALMTVTPAQAVTGMTTEERRPETQVTEPVATDPVTPLPAVAGARVALDDPDRDIVWPAPGSAIADVSRSARSATAEGLVQAGELPIWVGSADAAAATDVLARSGAVAPSSADAGEVAVEVIGQGQAERAGIEGLLLRLTTPAAAARVALASAATVRVDYSGFAHASGGDWASRLRLIELPACALTTPARAECRTSTPLPSTNDVSDQTVTGVVGLSAEGTGAERSGTVIALAAGASGTSGDWAATGLKASSTWEAGGPSGVLSWSYPLEMPPVAGDLLPQLSIDYSSNTVDGRTTSTNNQTSWIGEGFDLSPGFIERRYSSCADDMGDGANNTAKTYDLCWNTEDLALSFNGVGGELVRVGTTNQWRMRIDDGTRIERLTGGFNTDGGTSGIDGVGEYWKLTTPDGMQYFFGKGKTSSAATEATNSAWTVPVFGNHTGEPCRQTTFAASHCVQAWRWNLDHVIDPHGNTITYFYQAETNNYGRNLSTAVSSYVRGGYLVRIDYGERTGSEHTTMAAAQISFGTAERCLPSGSITCAPTQLTSANKSYWPDVPFDQICSSSTTCPDRVAPTFFSRKRLTTITTNVWNGSAYSPVDSWTLAHQFPAPLDLTSAALWLASIERKGHVGGTTTLPKVTFQGAQYNNRVAGVDGAPLLTKWRVISINSESGAMLSWSYAPEECSPTNLPSSPESNTKRCFPVYWSANDTSPPSQHWFHKYVITEVVETDRSDVTTEPVVTRYQYVGDTGWRYDDSPLTPRKYRTWSDYRGYETVRTTVGETGTTQSRTEALYYRGLDGGRATPSGGAKDIKVTDSEGVETDDHWRLQGMPREQRVFNGPGGAEVSGSINDYWISAATATEGTRHATLAAVGAERARTALAAGGHRRTETYTTYDSQGYPIEVDDLGDTTIGTDDLCARTTYARNTTAWIMATVAREETVSVNCSATPSRPADVVSDTRNFFDGSTTFGTAPTRGDVTREQELDSWSGGPVYVTTSTTSYDAHGRVTSESDALNRTTTTSFTPTTGSPVTAVTTTSPDPDGTGPLTAHVTTSQLGIHRGSVTSVSDPNANVTTANYDALGRLTKVWLPGRATNLTPNLEYVYTVRAAGPNAITTKQLTPSGAQVSAVEIFDGLLRPRQTQAQSIDGTSGVAGRVITDTRYDSRGLAVADRGPAFEAAAPATTLRSLPDGEMPSIFVTAYDGAERPVSKTYQIRGADQWQSTLTHGGDRISLDPPTGGTPTTTIVDARGRTTELRQYEGTSPSGAYDATTYTHTPDDQLATSTDSAGNVWTYDYDLRGRQVHADDPDKGMTTDTYDAASQLVTSTDARGVTLGYTYDALGRKSSVRDGSPTGAVRTSWVYDTLVKGQLTKSTRVDGGNSYIQEVSGYDVGYRPTGTKLTVPSAEGLLGNTYQTSHTYHVNGAPNTTTLQGRGGLVTETLTYGYDALGRPDTLGGFGSYVSDTVYSPYGEPLQLAMGNTFGKAIWETFRYEEGTRRLDETQLDREVVPTHTPDSVISYVHDDAGNLTEVKDTLPGGTPDTQCFDLDYLRRITEAWTPSSGNCAGTPSVAGLGGPAPYWHSWTFDSTGNRLSETRHAAAGNTIDTYAYPAAGADRPHAVNQVSTSGPGGPDTDPFSYDATGNTTTRENEGVLQTYTWDEEGHLATASEGSSVVAEYLYDADGNRLIAREGESTTLYWGGHTEVTLDTTTSTLSADRYYSHNGETVAVRTGTASADVHTLIADHHGTAHYSVANATGGLTVRRTLPYGGERGPQPTTWPSDHGFLDKPIDDPTGLVHVGAREYDPALGRFLSVDPVLDTSDPQQMHGYSYAKNNPLSYSDPTGLIPMGGGPGGQPTNDDYRAWNKKTTEHARALQRSTSKWAPNRFLPRKATHFRRREPGRRYQKVPAASARSRRDRIEAVAMAGYGVLSEAASHTNRFYGLAQIGESYRTPSPRTARIPEDQRGTRQHAPPRDVSAGRNLSRNQFTGRVLSLVDQSAVARRALKIIPGVGAGLALYGNLREDQSVGRAIVETAGEGAFAGVVGVGIGLACVGSAGWGCAGAAGGGIYVVGEWGDDVGEAVGWLGDQFAGLF